MIFIIIPQSGQDGRVYSYPSHEDEHHEAPNSRVAALALAKRGMDVFPCQHWPNKKPHFIRRLLEHGHLDASSDPDKVEAMWSHFPTASIGMRLEGIAVVDVETPVGHGVDGYASLARLQREDELGPLPDTWTVGTPSDGEHSYLRVPAGTSLSNRTRKHALAPGVEVKVRGYVIVPPSRGYSVKKRTAMAVLPDRWVDALRKKPEAPREDDASPTKAGHGPGVTRHLDGPKIPEGQRNSALASIAGSLHDGSRSLERLVAALVAVRNARCADPDSFSDKEVQKIAASIHSREPCKEATPASDREVLVELAGIEKTHLWEAEWKGARWKSPRSVLVALIKTARRHGQPHGDGVRVSISTRALALAAACSLPTAHASIGRLLERGILLKDHGVRGVDPHVDVRAGGFVLLRPATEGTARSSRAHAHFKQSNHPLSLEGERGSGQTVQVSQRGLTSPRLRWSSPGARVGRGTTPGTRRVRDSAPLLRDTISRLGKTREFAVDVLEEAGGKLHAEELTEIMGLSRVYDVLTRVLPPLCDAGVIELSEDGVVSLTEDWLENLNERRAADGELEAMKRDMKRYENQRKIYRERLRERHEERLEVVVRECFGGEIPEPELADPVIDEEPVVEAPPRDITHLVELKEDEYVEEGARLGFAGPPEATEDRGPSELALALRAFLWRNPRRSNETASWLAVAMWADGLVDTKPSQSLVAAARGELERLESLERRGAA